MKKTNVTVLDWNSPIGRNENGRFVSLKNVTVASTETAEPPVATPAINDDAKAKEVAKAPKAEKAPKAPKQVVIFTSGIYGSNEKNVQVVDKLVLGRKITNKLVGEDPHPKMKKTLIVKATIDGTEVERTFNEGDKLVF